MIIKKSNIYKKKSPSDVVPEGQRGAGEMRSSEDYLLWTSSACPAKKKKKKKKRRNRNQTELSLPLSCVTKTRKTLINTKR